MNLTPYIIGLVIAGLCFYFKYIPIHFAIVISCVSLLWSSLIFAAIYFCSLRAKEKVTESRTKLLQTVAADKVVKEKFSQFVVLTCLTVAGLVLSTIVSDFSWYAFIFIAITQIGTMFSFNAHVNDNYEELLNICIKEDE